LEIETAARETAVARDAARAELESAKLASEELAKIDEALEEREARVAETWAVLREDAEALRRSDETKRARLGSPPRSTTPRASRDVFRLRTRAAIPTTTTPPPRRRATGTPPPRRRRCARRRLCSATPRRKSGRRGIGGAPGAFARAGR